MKRFQCQACGAEVYFSNTVCERCKCRLGYLPDIFEMAALEPNGNAWTARVNGHPHVQLCRNSEFDACNWLIPAYSGNGYCHACQHNRTVPDLSNPVNLLNWRNLEQAKRHLFYSLMRWQLPTPLRAPGTHGLAFDFLADMTNPDGSVARVLTGHDEGLITVNVAEGDDAAREKARTAMGEPYRTLLGHFRHEIGHYYWDMLVRDGGRLDPFRAVFGDERLDYQQALQAHYHNGPRSDWQQSFISAYAPVHPWEDFAETWAHYFHIVDGTETAGAYGLSVEADINQGFDGQTSVSFQPYAAPSARAVIDTWVPFTVALNSVNRSMGQHDLYPFVVNPSVVQKLQFIHELIASCTPARSVNG